MLFSIGDFSKICDTPVPTLRYWEKEGLLRPEEIHTDTGYRFYSSRQIGLVQKIRAAKAAKFKNKEIRKICEDAYTLQMYVDKRDELIELKHETEESIRRLDFAIQNMMFPHWPEYKFVVIKSIHSGVYITHRQIFENIYTLLDYYTAMYNYIWQGKPTITDPYETYLIYYHTIIPEKEIDVECCIEVDETFDTKWCEYTEYQVKQIPAIETAASCLHYGPHETVWQTYSYLLEWINANDFVVCGHPRLNTISNEDTSNVSNFELYTTKEEEVCIITEVLVPVNKRVSLLRRTPSKII